MRRGVIILGLVLVLLLIGGSVYFFFLGGQERLSERLSGNDSSPDKSGAVTAPPPANRSVYELSQKRVVSPAFSHDFETIWYFDYQGKLYKNALDGTKEEEFVLSGSAPILKAHWPIAGNDFLLESAASAGIPAFRWFDSRVLAFTELPGNVVRLIWHPDGRQIIYVWKRSDGGLELKLSNPDTSRYQNLAKLSYPYMLSVSPDGEYVYLWRKHETGMKENFVYRVKLESDSLEFETFLDRGVNTGVLPSPNGAYLLFTRLNSVGSPEVWLHEFASGSFKNLKIPALVEKIAWLQNSRGFIYAQSKPSSGGAAIGDEVFYHGLEEGAAKQQSMEGLNLQVEVTDPLVHPDGKAFYFRNAGDGKLYRLNLQY